ncbi:hypothetical protein ESCO_000215 [Escovopsis weberi]|uniref:Uncharacterized protein n=1 Tax=Escovopsis weberi TaxID=150374 RepID=A0A0M8N451_ESCWE|nr:hypothetical protein ESCO_000215 [Escovopsis weberi]
MSLTPRRAPNGGGNDDDAAGRGGLAPPETPAAGTPRRGAREGREGWAALVGGAGRAVPSGAGLPLAVAMSFAAASLGYSVLRELTHGELAAVSRTRGKWDEIALLAAWRVLELSISWFAELDALDVAMMDLLSHGPTIYLLVAFFNLSAGTALGALAIDVLSASLPFLLLRPLSAVHAPGASSSASSLPNRELLAAPLQALTTALSASIYTVTLVLSLRFALPRLLVLYFHGLPTVEPAYAATYAAVLPATLVFGAAASTFIFPPFATAGACADDDAVRGFDPARATLAQTLRWNAWGYTAKTKVVIRRTALTALATGVNTYLACAVTIPGVEAAGAAGYAAVWVLATVCTGVGLGFVGRDE